VLSGSTHLNVDTQIASVTCITHKDAGVAYAMRTAEVSSSKRAASQELPNCSTAVLPDEVRLFGATKILINAVVA